MRIEIGRTGIKIYPENAQDEAYIEDTLGLWRKGDTIALRRIAPSGLDLSIAYLEARKQED